MRMNLDLESAFTLHGQSLLITFDCIGLRGLFDHEQWRCDVYCSRYSTEIDEAKDGSIAVLCGLPSVE